MLNETNIFTLYASGFTCKFLEGGTEFHLLTFILGCIVCSIGKIHLV